MQSRIRVSYKDPTQRLPEARRNPYTPDAAVKSRVLRALVHAHVYFAKLFSVSGGMSNITTMTQISSHILTLHNISRQAANVSSTGRISEKCGGAFTIHHNNVQKSLANGLETLLPVWQRICKAYELTYAWVNNKPPEWVGVMTPFLAFSAAFMKRMAEVRGGCLYLPVGKDGDQMTVIDIHQFLLDASHQVLLDGITFPPSLKSAMAQSLGPMTQAIMLYRTRHQPQYADKWARALTRTLAHLEDCQSIISSIRDGVGAEVLATLKSLADVLLITGSRASVKAYFPICFIIGITTGTVVTAMQDEPDEPMEGQQGEPTFSPILEQNWTQLDQSGKGCFYLWTQLKEVTFRINPNGDVEDIRQVVFHSVFGSHWEDLNIAKYMTGVEFKRREELGNIFRGKGSTATEKTFKLLPLNFYSKLSQALPTKMTAGGVQQLMNRVAFAGQRQIELSAQFTSFLRGEDRDRGYDRNSVNVANSLSRYKKWLAQ